jgi:DNA-binding GntR family transcriptional regulator
MKSSIIHAIVEALTKAIPEYRLQPGTKLAAHKLANHFAVWRMLEAEMTPNQFTGLMVVF